MALPDANPKPMRWIFALWLAGCAASSPVATSTPPAASPPPSAAAGPTTPTPPVAALPPPIPQAPLWNYDVLQRVPHDPEAFTQGLMFDESGQLWESTGLKGRSTLRQISMPEGRVRLRQRLKDHEFGEGLARTRGNFFWLTWQNEVCHSYDTNLKPHKDFPYAGEGWGLCTDPSGDLWMSTGSHLLTLRDPLHFQIKKTIPVTYQDQPVPNLNELEWVDGKIYANIWGTPLVAVIQPEDGKLQGYIDFSGLLSQDEAAHADVLNGIAYDPKEKALWVTGKLWPKMFRVQVRGMP